jgi:hypothetical protein
LLSRDNCSASYRHTARPESNAAARFPKDLAADLPVWLHRMFPDGCASVSWTGSEAHLSGNSITEH